MKHYSIIIRSHDKSGHLINKQTIEFDPCDCKSGGKVERTANPNKRMVFCAFNALVEACMEAMCEDECYRWEIRVCESDTKGDSRYITFWATAYNTDSVYTSINDKTIDCGCKYDEFFDSWLF